MLPLALSTAAVLLLSSLSLQTLAMHGRQRSRQLFTTAERADGRQSVAMDFLQRASAASRSSCPSTPMVRGRSRSPALL